MCDETTERELEAYLKRKAMTRRGFTVGASATIAAGSFALSACATPQPDPGTITEAEVQVPTPDGDVDALFIHPV